MPHSTLSSSLQGRHLQEQPILRIEFLTPEGELRQATISTDWTESPSLPRSLFTGECDTSIGFRHALTEAVIGLCATVKCRFASLSLVETCNRVGADERLIRMTEADTPKPALRLIQGGRLAASAFFLALWMLCETAPQEALEAAQVRPPVKAAPCRILIFGSNP